MVDLRYAADCKEADWLTRQSLTRTGLFARSETTPRRQFFKLRGSSLAAHAEESYPELWRSPVKEVISVDPESYQLTLRLDKSVLVVAADDKSTYERWVDAVQQSAGAEFERFYRRERAIGKGHFSQVYLASDRSTGEKFAVKIIKKDRNDASKSKKFIRREVKVLSLTDHPNLVKAIDFFSANGKPHIIMEYVRGGSLRDLIRKKRRLSEEEARPILSGILKGIAYMHQLNIVHRDIKPENILMHEPDFPKITDFGLATFRNEDKHIHSVVGTPSYVAPELIRNLPYGPPADVWSCGIVLYYMLVGERPFTGDTRDEIKRAVLAGDLTYPNRIFGSSSMEVRNLLNLMLSYDQNSRIIAKDALQHPWMSSNG